MNSTYNLKGVKRDNCEMYFWNDGTLTFYAECDLENASESLELTKEETRDLYLTMRKYYES